MKKLVKLVMAMFILIVSVFSVSAYNALNASDDDPIDVVYVDAAGEVGIGTTSPNFLLDIRGEINTNDSLYQPVYGSDDDLVLYLPFSRGSGSAEVYDRSPYGNDGVCKDGVSETCDWTSGKYGNALNFDGSNDIVSISDDSSLDISGDFTVSAWVNPDDNNPFNQIIVSKFTNQHDGNYELTTFDNGKGYPNIQFNNGFGATGWKACKGTTEMQANTWYYLAGTFDNTTKVLKIYLNGIEEKSCNAAATDAPIANNGQLGIGNRANLDGNYFDGQIDEVRVYDRALSPEEIRTHYLRSSSFGSVGAITADKFRVVDTSGNVKFSVSNGNVGIGIEAPDEKLEVNGSINVTSGNDICIEGGNCLSTAATGGWADSGSSVHLITSTDKVGIGTTSPSAKLEVNGSSTFAPSALPTWSTNPELRISTDSSRSNALLLEFDDQNTVSPILSFGSGAGTATIETGSGQALNIDVKGSSSSGLKIRTDNGVGTLVERFSVQAGAPLANASYVNGHVGIGIAKPDALLHLKGYNLHNLVNSVLVVDSGASNKDTGITFDRNGVSYWAWNLRTANENDKMILYDIQAGNVPRIVVNRSGYVGIGELNPKARLDVAGTAEVDTLEVQNMRLGVNDNNLYIKKTGSLGGSLGVGTEDPQARLDVNGTARASTVDIQNIRLGINDGNLYIINASGSGGRVAIGKNDPGVFQLFVNNENGDDLLNLRSALDGGRNLEFKYSDANNRMEITSDATNNIAVVGALTVTGKANFPGGVDPPYVSFSDESHQSIREYAQEVDPHEKVMQFWNKDAHRFEVYVIAEDSFYTMTGDLIEE